VGKFMLVRFSFMAEITDPKLLRDAAVKNFDETDMTSAAFPVSADWHASEEGQQERREVETQDRDALDQLVDAEKACGLLDGVPGAEPLGLTAVVSELKGDTPDEARADWAAREGIPWLAGLPEWPLPGPP
jgi:hypothetical protein